MNWRYSGLDGPASDDVYDTIYGAGWERDLNPLQSPPAFRDKVPMIVPPTGAKGTYYANLVLRSQWRLAAAALRQSREMTVIGYSMPQTDSLVLGMVAGEFRGGILRIVDLRPNLGKELKGLLAADVNVDTQ